MIDLQSPLSWKQAHEATHPDAAAQLAMLNDLQGNILKGHGRHYTSNLFLRFDEHRATEARAFVRETSGLVTTALHQLTQTHLYKMGQASSSTFFAFMLSADGYAALNKQDVLPEGEAFRNGMKTRDLNDDISAWDEHFKGRVDAMVLIAAETEELRNRERDNFCLRIAATNGAVGLLNPRFQEDGNAIFNKPDNNGIEHFGYVDGRSQPLCLVEDIEQERDQHGGINAWDPTIPLGQLLVRCPGGRLQVSHGSFFVFRKLEQNVREFKRREVRLAEQIEDRQGKARGSVGELLGATVVGRFENGTPVTMSDGAISPIPPGPVGVKNNFNFAADPNGLKCPFSAHIRKTNPRDDLDDSKTHLMARRGITYGVRTDLDDPSLNTKPTRDVGLLFMAYQSSLEAQFEFTQSLWANNPQFLRPTFGGGNSTGIDPIIGQPARPSGQQWPQLWNGKLTDGRPEDEFSGFVTTKGGEYFFAPSISFLKKA